jgi:hypothetical protein
MPLNLARVTGGASSEWLLLALTARDRVQLGAGGEQQCLYDA